MRNAAGIQLLHKKDKVKPSLYQRIFSCGEKYNFT